ncbi:MAG TPA: sulfatase-like hydrolase/transferase, partial [Lentisphaeria bacterium]|nr:sulfatase-like hydrolase/transferase [Lentisphaeria bacterium]
NTIVIYTSDHGENKGDHGMWWKNNMYEHSARVPLIVRWPARWAGGQVRRGACSLLDVVQTIVELAGGRAPEDWNGDSMVRWLDDAQTPWKDVAVSEYYGHYISSGVAMIRRGAWKYVYHSRADAAHGPERELYHLESDPKEFNNRAGDPAHRDLIAALHGALVKEIGEDPDETELRFRRERARPYDD